MENSKARHTHFPHLIDLFLFLFRSTVCQPKDFVFSFVTIASYVRLTNCMCFDRETILFACPALHIHPHIAAMSHQLLFITKSISDSSNTHTSCTLHKLNVIKFGERIEFYYVFRILLCSISSITQYASITQYCVEAGFMQFGNATSGWKSLCPSHIVPFTRFV